MFSGKYLRNEYPNKRMSLRTSDRCHWCGNPSPPAFPWGQCHQLKDFSVGVDAHIDPYVRRLAGTFDFTDPNFSEFGPMWASTPTRRTSF